MTGQIAQDARAEAEAKAAQAARLESQAEEHRAQAEAAQREREALDDRRIGSTRTWRRTRRGIGSTRSAEPSVGPVVRPAPWPVVRPPPGRALVGAPLSPRVRRPRAVRWVERARCPMTTTSRTWRMPRTRLPGNVARVRNRTGDGTGTGDGDGAGTSG